MRSIPAGLPFLKFILTTTCENWSQRDANRTRDSVFERISSFVRQFDSICSSSRALIVLLPRICPPTTAFHFRLHRHISSRTFGGFYNRTQLTILYDSLPLGQKQTDCFEGAKERFSK